MPLRREPAADKSAALEATPAADKSAALDETKAADKSAAQQEEKRWTVPADWHVSQHDGDERIEADEAFLDMAGDTDFMLSYSKARPFEAEQIPLTHAGFLEANGVAYPGPQAYYEATGDEPDDFVTLPGRELLNLRLYMLKQQELSREFGGFIKPLQWGLKSNVFLLDLPWNAGLEQIEEAQLRWSVLWDVAYGTRQLNDDELKKLDAGETIGSDTPHEEKDRIFRKRLAALEEVALDWKERGVLHYSMTGEKAKAWALGLLKADGTPDLDAAKASEWGREAGAADKSAAQGDDKVPGDDAEVEPIVPGEDEQQMEPDDELVATLQGWIETLDPILTGETSPEPRWDLQDEVKALAESYESGLLNEPAVAERLDRIAVSWKRLQEKAAGVVAAQAAPAADKSAAPAPAASGADRVAQVLDRWKPKPTTAAAGSDGEVLLELMANQMIAPEYQTVASALQGLLEQGMIGNDGIGEVLRGRLALLEITDLEIFKVIPQLDRNGDVRSERIRLEVRYHQEGAPKPVTRQVILTPGPRVEVLGREAEAEDRLLKAEISHRLHLVLLRPVKLGGQRDDT